LLHVKQSKPRKVQQSSHLLDLCSHDLAAPARSLPSARLAMCSS
jgi:hypothetical protein